MGHDQAAPPATTPGEYRAAGRLPFGPDGTSGLGCRPGLPRGTVPRRPDYRAAEEWRLIVGAPVGRQLAPRVVAQGEAQAFPGPATRLKMRNAAVGMSWVASFMSPGRPTG